MDGPTNTQVLLSAQLRNPGDLDRIAMLVADLAGSEREVTLKFNLVPLDSDPPVTIQMSTPNINATFITAVLSEALLYDFQITLHAVILL